MTLLDFFPDDFLIIVDESHMTIPQIRGMYAGDRSRKQTLVDYGFRLPSALDNRPLNFEEFEAHIDQMMFVSATPSDYEKEHELLRTEQIIRPTGLLDPEVQVRPVEGQIDDLIGEVNKEIAQHHKVLITTLTKRMAEDLTDYMKEVGIRVKYLHSDIDTLERAQIIRDMRLDVFDVLVGINLLREGLDIPEITLVAILDADKEGFLRSATSLIQTIGRAARNAEGHVIMYADTITDSMREALDETNRRRVIQMKYNEEHGITPQTIKKAVRDLISISKVIAKEEVRFEKDPESMTKKELEARNEVKWEMYTKKIQIEARVLGDLAMNHIIPVATQYQSDLIDNVYKMKDLFPAEKAAKLSAKNLELIEEIADRTAFIKEHVDAMIEARKVANKIESEREKAIAYHDNIVPMMEEIRYHIDKLELIVDNQMWTLPKYRELLFIR